MIQVNFKCKDCKCEKGIVFAHDRDVVVECTVCKRWEMLNIENDGNSYTKSYCAGR